MSALWIRAQKVAQVPSKAPFSKRFEEAVGQASRECGGAPGGATVRMAESTVRAIDLRS